MKRKAVCIYTYKASDSDELTITKGESILIEEEKENGTWGFGHVENRPKARGLFPLNHVKDIKIEQKELEARASAVEKALFAERRTADACRSAAETTLDTLENYLTRTMSSGYLLLELPRGVQQEAKSAGEQLAIRLMTQIKKRLQGNHGRRELPWTVLCSCLDECLKEEQKLISPSKKEEKGVQHTPPRLRSDIENKQVSKRIPTRNEVAHMRQEMGCLEEDGFDDVVSGHREQRKRKEETLAAVFLEYDRGVRCLFREYAKDNKDTDLCGLVSPADFLRCCKDTSICTALLSRQEVTTIYRLCMGALSSPAQVRSSRIHAPVGLNEEQFQKALVRCAVAAYSHLPVISKAEKLEALFTHMGIKPDSKSPINSFDDQLSHFSDNDRFLSSTTTKTSPSLPRGRPPLISRISNAIQPGEPAPIHFQQQHLPNHAVPSHYQSPPIPRPQYQQQQPSYFPRLSQEHERQQQQESSSSLVRYP